MSLTPSPSSFHWEVNPYSLSNPYTRSTIIVQNILDNLPDTFHFILLKHLPHLFSIHSDVLLQIRKTKNIPLCVLPQNQALFNFFLSYAILHYPYVKALCMVSSSVQGLFSPPNTLRLYIHLAFKNSTAFRLVLLLFLPSFS